jgi:hypothetical protein
LIRPPKPTTWAPATTSPPRPGDALDNLGLSADPLNSNRYLFTGANPINFIELDGHGFGGWVKKKYNSAKNSTAGKVASLACDLARPCGVAKGLAKAGTAAARGDWKGAASGLADAAGGRLVKTALKGAKTAARVADDRGTFKRPSRLRKSTHDAAVSSAKPHPKGGMACPTCGRQMKDRKDYHLDHHPEKNRDIVKRLKSERPPVDRRRYLDEYNKPSNVRTRCPRCNVRDNR